MDYYSAVRKTRENQIFRQKYARFEMKKKVWFIMIVVCSTVFISSCNKGDIGSAAKDPNAYRINGLVISLDESVWDCEDYGTFEMSPMDPMEKTEMTTISLKSDIKCELANTEIRPTINMIYTRFIDGYTFEDFLDDQEQYIDNIKSYSREELLHEGHNALCDIYTVNDNTYYSYYIWTQKAFYGVTYIAGDRFYEDYFDNFKKSIESIHIEYF